MGLENVHSQTTLTHGAPPPARPRVRPGPAQGKEEEVVVGGPGGPRVEEEEEVQGGGGAAGKGKEGEEPPQKMKMKAELVHVGVKEFSSRGKDRHFGYIITDSE